MENTHKHFVGGRCNYNCNCDCVKKGKCMFEIAGIVGGILFTVFLVVMEIIVWFPSVLNKS